MSSTAFGSAQVFDHEIEDAFFEAFDALCEAVRRERSDYMEIVSAWAGVRPSTAYEWKGRRTMVKDPCQVLRLILCSTAAGFGHFVARFVQGMRLAPLEKAGPNGSLLDERRDLDFALVRVWQAHGAGDSEGVRRGALEIHEIADRIDAEGLFQQPPLAPLRAGNLNDKP